MFDFITQSVAEWGYFGIAFLMLAENVFPPIPSELIMPLAGFVAAQGKLNIWLVILSGSIGSVAGATFWYYIGLWFGRERLKAWTARHGRWFTMTPDEVDEAFAWFDRHRGMAVFLGRLLPSIRTLISVPAGIARMPLLAFLAWSTVGTAIWTSMLAAAGYVLESQYERVESFINPVSTAIVVGVVLFYLYRVVTFDKRAKRRGSSV